MDGFAIQLALNLGWSAIFFGLHHIGAALVEMAYLWLAILTTVILFCRATGSRGAVAALSGLGQVRGGP